MFKRPKPNHSEWILLIGLFLLMGIIGHDPWKQTETYSFGIIYHFYTAGTWLIPVNGNLPFMEKPPLYYWTANLFCHLLSGLLPLHDAARMASVFYMLITTIFLWKSSRLLFSGEAESESLAWICLALMLGSIGIVFHAHEMSTDTTLLAGAAIALYGMEMMACFPERWVRAGFWLGLGTGIAFMSKGFFMPAVLALALGILLITLPEVRTRRTLWTLFAALVAVLPFLGIWPTLLYFNNPGLFHVWFWENNVGRFLGFSVAHLGAENKPGYFLYTVLWFAFPIFPLSLLEVIAARRGKWRGRVRIIPLALCISGMAVLLASATARAVYLLPFFPAFALLGAQGTRRLPSRFFKGWNIFVRLAASMSALGLWLVWWSMLHHDQPVFKPVAEFSGQWLPIHFMPPGNETYAVCAAAAVALLWIASFRFSGKTTLNAAYIWLAAVTLVWGTAFTLLLPWINNTKSYRSVLKEMHVYVQNSPYAGECIADGGLGESISPMLQYFGRRPAPSQNFNGDACPLMLTVTTRNAPLTPDTRWELVWRGSRVLDAKNEQLRLYHRIGATSSAPLKH